MDLTAIICAARAVAHHYIPFLLCNYSSYFFCVKIKLIGWQICLCSASKSAINYICAHDGNYHISLWLTVHSF